jgi:hypothetical protein
MDLGLLVVSLYVTIDDWWEVKRPAVLLGPGRTVLLSESEVLTLAVLVQWLRWRSERDFWRYTCWGHPRPARCHRAEAAGEGTGEAPGPQFIR